MKIYPVSLSAVVFAVIVLWLYYIYILYIPIAGFGSKTVKTVVLWTLLTFRLYPLDPVGGETVRLTANRFTGAAEPN